MRNRTAERRRTNIHEDTTSRNYQPGDRVYGMRSPNAYVGTYISMKATLNNGYRNPSYLIKCDIDGKERRFQLLRSFSKDLSEHEKTYYNIK